MIHRLERKNLLSNKTLDPVLDPAGIPNHVAIIMDGNRRWAHQHHLPSGEGHRIGAQALKAIVEACGDLGVGILTAYAFSKENWKRSHQEIKLILYLFDFYLKREREELRKNGVRFRVIGRLGEMSPRLQEEFRKTEETTKHNTKLLLNLAVNYGGRAEIVDAVKAIAEKAVVGEILPSQIDDEMISKHLYTAGLADPDLLIRTSGEQRVSNFLLWQLAYTEFWFTPLFWPEFTKDDLIQAFVEYQRRHRRLGGS